VVSGVGPGIHVLDGRPRASSGRVCFWHGLWHFSASRHALISTGLMTLRNAFDSCVKSWQHFRTHGIPLNSVSNSLFYDIVRFKIEVHGCMGVEEKFTCKKCIKTNATCPLWSNDNAAAVPAAMLAAAQSIPAGVTKQNRPFESLPWANYVTKKGDVFLSTKERRALLKLLWGGLVSNSFTSPKFHLRT